MWHLRRLSTARLAADDNHALSFVHGVDDPRTFTGAWTSKSTKGRYNTRNGCRIRFGGAAPGRDYMVWTVNSFVKIVPESAYFFRQYVSLHGAVLSDR